MRMARKIQETEKGTAIYGATKFADLTSKKNNFHKCFTEIEKFHFKGI